MGFEISGVPADNDTPVKFFIELGETARSEVFIIDNAGNVQLPTSGVGLSFSDGDHLIKHNAAVGFAFAVPVDELFRWTIAGVQEMVLLADAVNFGAIGTVNGRLAWPTAGHGPEGGQGRERAAGVGRIPAREPPRRGKSGAFDPP